MTNTSAPATVAIPYTEADRRRAVDEWREFVARCAAAEDIERLNARRAWRALVGECAAAGLE